MWSDRQVRGSPFKVNVVAASDASKVICTGEGLKVGIMGREIKSTIDTRRAGPGELPFLSCSVFRPRMACDGFNMENHIQ